MIRIQIEPVWRFSKDDGARSMLVMMDFLHEIRTTGKITRAADQAAMSYRHAWNLIEKWSAFFEAPLVDRRQGRGTTLTPLGEKLVWAGQRLRARLKPQLDNLSQELETEINQLLPHGPSIIRVHASHGFAVAKLREMLSCEPEIGVDLRYVSNQTSLASLARGECDLAGMHLPQGELRQRSIAACKGWLSPTQHRVISFVTREIGLIVKSGNPLKIDSLERLLDPAVSRYPLPWLPVYARKMQDMFGGDPFPYGIEENRPTLEQFMRYTYEQGIAKRHVKPEDIFPKGIMTLVRV